MTATDTAKASGSVTFSITVDPGSQVISFTAPATGMVGQSGTLTATGGGSGNPVVFTVDSASGAGVCFVAGSGVYYSVAGSSVIDANQPGNASYLPAPQVRQTITVGPGWQAIAFTAPAAGFVGQSATLTAMGGASGNPVVFTVDSTSGRGVCKLSGVRVSYTAAGKCVIDANQAGSANYLPAPQVTQTITVNPLVPTAMYLTLSKSKITYGHEQTEHLRVQMRASGTPVGSVIVKAGSKLLCTIKLKSGTGTCTLEPRKLKPGRYTLIARYPGYSGFGASTAPKDKLRAVK